MIFKGWQQPRNGSGNGASWTPAVLGSKLGVWLDAEDISTLTMSGSLVSGWRNKVSDGILTQTIGSLMPVYQPTGLNGRPTVFFDGTDDYLTSTSSFTALNAGGLGVEREVWFLTDQKAAPGDTSLRNLLRQGTDFAQRLQIQKIPLTGVNRMKITAGNDSPTVNLMTAVYDGIHVGRGQLLSATNLALSQDGGVPTTATTSSFVVSPGFFTIGSQNASANFWLGSVNTVIMTQPLTTLEATELLNYLKLRGGIS